MISDQNNEEWEELSAAIGFATGVMMAMSNAMNGKDAAFGKETTSGAMARLTRAWDMLRLAEAKRRGFIPDEIPDGLKSRYTP